jgi:hypothetical protein
LELAGIDPKRRAETLRIPEPKVGLVIRYAYLWRDEARRGLTEGKDRPAVIVLAVDDRSGETVVTVAPISRSKPRPPAAGIEIPADVKVRLGLDDQPSWIVASDLNAFIWPGVDLRPTRPRGNEIAYGFMPRGLVWAAKELVVGLARSGTQLITMRSGFHEG